VFDGYFSVISSGDFVLSLNGSDSLDESQTMRELGVVNGDLLHVIVVGGDRGGQPCCIRCGDVTGLKTANQLCSCSHVTNKTEVTNDNHHATDTSVENTALGVEHGQSPNMGCGHKQNMAYAYSQNTPLNPNMERGQNTADMEHGLKTADMEHGQNTAGLKCGQKTADMERGRNTADMECGQILDPEITQDTPLNPNIEGEQPPFHSEAQAVISILAARASSGDHFEEFLRGQLPPGGLCRRDALSLALHALMLDSGFTEQEVWQ